MPIGFLHAAIINLKWNCCNQDNSINVADLVMTHKVILNQNSLDYDSYVLADLTFDGLVDSFDLMKMRQLIIKQKSNNI